MIRFETVFQIEKRGVPEGYRSTDRSVSIGTIQQLVIGGSQTATPASHPNVSPGPGTSSDI